MASPRAVGRKAASRRARARNFVYPSDMHAVRACLRVISPSRTPVRDVGSPCESADAMAMPIPPDHSRCMTAGGNSSGRALEERIGAIAATQHGVITRRQLLDLGIRPGVIQRRVLGGRLRRLHRGVFAVGPLLPAHARPMAAVLACGPEAVLSHRSAAALFGLVDSADDGDTIDVAVPLPVDRARPGVRVRRLRRLALDERTTHEGIPVTTPARTLLDLAAVARPPELERALARAERGGLATPDEMIRLAERHRHRPGIRVLDFILRHAGGPSLTRSEAEARFLSLVRRSRLPAPSTNVTVDAYEIDFLWPDHGVAVEVDGYRYHASRPSFEADRRRASRLAALGIQVVPLTWRQIVDEELATAVQLGQALLHAQTRGTKR